MADATHEDSSTDVEDSSTVVSDASEDDDNMATGARPSASRPMKRPTAPSPSVSPQPAKRPKLLQPDQRQTMPCGSSLANIPDLLRSKPQDAAMEATRNNAHSCATVESEHSNETPQTKVSKPAEDKKAIPDAHPTLPSEHFPLVSDFSFSSFYDPASWQQHETILEFLRRLPVADPATAEVGPWLWVRCPRDLQDWQRERDYDAFMRTAEPLLDSLLRQRSILEQQNVGKAPATITRKMGPDRDQLEIDLLNAATTHQLTSGKWMLFPKAKDLPRVWRLVAEATASGKLGPTSKVATWEPDHATKGTLICVYTYDFSDLVDVKRVLSALIENDVVKRDPRFYYKCDAYTHLNIFAENSYKLRASLYSSEEVLNDKVKYTAGVIARLKKKGGGAMENFPTS